MATRLGDVWMAFRLDTAQAEKDLNKLEDRAKRSQVDQNVKNILDTKKAGKSGQTDVGPTQGQMRVTDQLKKFGAAAIKRVGAPAQVLANRFGLPTLASGFLPAGGMAAIGGAAGIAAGVTALYQGIMHGPEFVAFARQVSGVKPGENARLDALEKVLDSLRNEIVKIQAAITSIPEGVKQTTDYTRAAMRLTGELPDTLFYAKENVSISYWKKRLDDRFDQFKAREAPFVFPRMMIDIVSRSLSR